MAKPAKKVLLGVTGSIAAYKAGDIIRRLQDRGCDVTVVMTKEAEQFITPLTLAGLSGKPVFNKMFDEGQKAWSMPHISLATEAEVLLIAPATANIIAKLAHGLADDLLMCIAITTRAPMIIAPAMNVEMYQNKIVADNCKKLISLGAKFVEPTKGKLACGIVGTGHLADVDDIVDAVLKV
jgi:phosphopantothenoylcysteine decarboxylase/phosphopantothenate--cysteine ligase